MNRRDCFKVLVGVLLARYLPVKPSVSAWVIVNDGASLRWVIGNPHAVDGQYTKHCMFVGKDEKGALDRVMATAKTTCSPLRGEYFPEIPLAALPPDAFDVSVGWLLSHVLTG